MTIRFIFQLVVVFSVFFLTNCSTSSLISDSERKKNETAFLTVMNTHLKAISTKDIALLGTTLPSNEEMYLLLDGMEMTTQSDEFLKLQKDWFDSGEWTFETKIVRSDVGIEIGYAIVESLYKEPNRNGKPYFNRMLISYDLKKIEGKWYVVKDQATSIEKTKLSE